VRQRRERIPVAFETVNDRRSKSQPDDCRGDALPRRVRAVLNSLLSFVSILATLIIQISARPVAIALVLFVFVLIAGRRSSGIQIITQSFILSLFLIIIRKAGFIAL
jgi:hypothetical protein